MTAIACGWLDDGTVDAARSREATATQRCAKRMAAASARRPELRRVIPSSYFVWLPLPEEVRADQVAVALMREGISVSTAEPFATSRHVPHALRLALGSVALDSLDSALRTVRRVVGAYAF